MRIIAIGILLVGLIVIALYSRLEEQPIADMEKPAAMPAKEMATSSQESEPSEPPANNEKSAKYAVDVVLHSREEILELLRNTDRVALRPKPEGIKPTIALVLHGPEVDFFAIKNYQEYKDVVDLAAKLDAYRHVEIKMCQTMMRKRGLKNDDIPGFIDLVPYGPGELQRLLKNGYTYL